MIDITPTAPLDVVIITKNNLDLTKRCVESVQRQDIPTRIHVYDNMSTDGTRAWLEAEKTEKNIIDQSSDDDLGVSAAWNFVLEIVFSFADREEVKWGWHAKHALVVNNDVVLPSWLCSSLLAYNLPFVTGVGMDLERVVASDSPRPEIDPTRLSPHPDFSCFLLTREAWQQVGEFDEEMVLYASDCDWHVRAHRLGFELWKAPVPYYHVNSQTMKRASERDRRRISEQANTDRAVFERKYGCVPGTPEYADLFR